MKSWSIAFVAVAFAGAAYAQNGPDPVALTKADKVQCYAPNNERKTCGSIAAYARDAQGRIVNTAHVLLSVQPSIVLTTRSFVTVDHGTICGAVRAEDIAAGELLVGGAPPAADASTRIKTKLTGSLGPVLGKRICTHYTPDGPVLRAHEVVDGVAENPASDQRVTWVAADEHYRVAP